MKKEEKDVCNHGAEFAKGTNASNGVFGWLYCLSIVGAAVYFVQQASGFWMGVLGILKAMVWPAILIYKVFKIIGL